jgi:hypothetical protein
LQQLGCQSPEPLDLATFRCPSGLSDYIHWGVSKLRNDYERLWLGRPCGQHWRWLGGGTGHFHLAASKLQGHYVDFEGKASLKLKKRPAKLAFLQCHCNMTSHVKDIDSLIVDQPVVEVCCCVCSIIGELHLPVKQQTCV